MSDLRRDDPVRLVGEGKAAVPQALSESGKSVILESTEMMQSHPIRSSTEEPSGDGTTDSTAQAGPSDVAEPGASRTAVRVTFGEELRRERELRQVELREIADSTKINVRYLEALERNDFSELPGGLFNRSFVRAYCQTIGIDDEVMVNAYLLEEQTQAAKADQFDPDVWRGDPLSRGTKRQAGRPARDRRTAGSVWWWVLAVTILALSVGAWIYWRYWPLDPASMLPVGEHLPGSILATSAVALETKS